MWIHLGILAVLVIVYAVNRVRPAHSGSEAGRRNLRLFFLVAAAGNLLGFFLTFQEMQKPAENLSRFERRESASHEEELEISLEGGTSETVHLQIPAKEKPASEEAPDEEESGFMETEKMRRARAISEEVVKYNQSRKDPDYYYLPDRLDGKTAVWRRPEEKQGQLLAGLFLAGGLLILLWGNREEQKNEQKRQEQMLYDYPPMIMKFTLLLQAGMSVRGAFQKMAADYQKEERDEERNGSRIRTRKPRRYVQEEILKVCNELDSGVSEAEAYRHLGERCRQIRYRSFSTLLIQNLQKGSRSLLDNLERESMDAWEERKRKARMAGETASTKLLFPMLLMLLVVMALIMIPAFLAFWG